jgi:aminopeptidase-like protein
MAMLWVLNLADGDHSLLDIADRASLTFNSVLSAAARLLDSGLLKEAIRCA